MNEMEGSDISIVQGKLYIFSSAFQECSSEKRDSMHCETQYRELALDKHILSVSIVYTLVRYRPNHGNK